MSLKTCEPHRIIQQASQLLQEAESRGLEGIVSNSARQRTDPARRAAGSIKTAAWRTAKRERYKLRPLLVRCG